MGVGQEGSEGTLDPLNQIALGAQVTTVNVWQENNGNTGDSKGQDRRDPPSPGEASKAPCKIVKH